MVSNCLFKSSDGTTPNLYIIYIFVGVHVFMNGLRSDSHIWVKIRKLGFKRKRFVIKLYPTATEKVRTLSNNISNISAKL